MLRSSFGRAKPKQLSAGKTGRYYFTLHAEYKMREYHLSRQRVIRIIRSPKRQEVGIVPNTIAVMQPASTKRVGSKPARNGFRSDSGREIWTQELWVMYKVQTDAKLSKSKLAQILNQAELKIISAWRYPGVSPKRDPIPSDILREIENREENDENSA